MTSDIKQGGWYSKRSIMRDIARATGIRHFDDTCFVVGESAPPRRSYNEDVDMMYGDVPENIPNEVQLPDLNGIKEMLRMVNNETVDSIPTTALEEPSCTNDILTITKLNPEVEEFFPASTTNSAIYVKQNNCQNNSNKEQKELIISKRSESSPKCNSKVDAEKDLFNFNNKTNGHSTLPANNIKEMREQLKTKISNNANKNCIKSKREKNLAMASLLKLCSQAPEGTNEVMPSKPSLTTASQKQNTDPTKNAPLKLLPPDYFDKKIESSDKCELFHEENRTDSNAAINNQINGNVSMPNIQSLDDEDIQNSVRKVESWLAGVPSGNPDDPNSDQPTPEKDPPKTKSTVPTPKKQKKSTGPPTLFLGPVTFKRKEVVKSNSPSVNSESTARNTPTTSYVPSAYASELSRSYNERAKLKKVIKDDVMSKLHTSELDRRDEEYRKKMAESMVSTSVSDIAQDDTTQ